MRVLELGRTLHWALALVVGVGAIAAACCSSGDDMNGGGMRFRGDQAMRIDPATLQAYVRWGDQQSIANIVAPAPGSIFVFPAIAGLQAFPSGPGGIVALNQLVEARYHRPTTWTVSLYMEAVDGLPTGDSFGVVWSVRSSTGAANNELIIPQQYVSPGITQPVFPTSVLQSFQLPAQAIQIIPRQVSYSMGAAGTRQSMFRWSAWVAPVVE